MKRIFQPLMAFLVCSSAAFPAFGAGKFSDKIAVDDVRAVINASIDWQRNNMPTFGRAIWNPRYTGWADGVFMSAVSDWARYDNSFGFKEWCAKIAREVNWEPGIRSLNPANDLAVSLMYANLWLDDPQPKYTVERIEKWDGKTIMGLLGGWKVLIPTIERLDYQVKYCPRTDNLDFEVPQNQERWCWCDALYVAPPTFILFSNITGNKEYLDFMEREFWMTVHVLYDKEERLFFRDTRYMSQREANGEKVFWGRGNGWVIGSLARILNYLPETHPTRDRYEQLFREMMSRIVTLQGKDGYWRTSLLDPVTYPSPEASATGFFTFGLWWGINNGLLSEKEYLPAAKKAWSAMVAAVHPDGKLGYVQPIGDAPQNITADKNEVYGTAAFALSGLEVAAYAAAH